MKDLRSRCNDLIVLLALGSLLGFTALEGHAQNSLAASDSTVNFGAVVVGNHGLQSDYISNPSASSIVISTAVASNVDFHVVAPKLPVTIAPGRRIRLLISFAPAAAGTVNGSIAISSSARPSAVNLSVSGKGILPGQLSATPLSINFGNVAMGANQSKRGVFTNSGGTPVWISQAAATTGDFTVSGLSLPMTLQPAQSVNFNVVFTPKSKGNRGGNIAVAAVVSLLAPGGSPHGGRRGESVSLAIPMTGVGTDGAGAGTPGHVTVSSNPLSFGKVQVGNTQRQSATITNSGGSTVTVSQTSVTGSAFSASGMSMPMKLSPNQSATLTISCTPKTSGTLNGSLTVASDAANGMVAVPLLASGVMPGSLSASATPLNFGSVAVGSSHSLPETITNNGGASITLTQAAAGAGFSISGMALPVTLAPGQGASFSVVFAPQAAGASSVNLTLVNSSSTPTFSIPLSGSGLSSGSLTASSVSFGSVEVGASSTRSATLTNSGSSSVTISQASLTGSGFTMSGLSVPLTLSAKQSLTFSVTYAPESAGAASGKITLVSTASGSTPSIILSGSGGATGQFSVSPGSFSFGSVAVGATKSLPVTLSATGSSVTVTSASVSSSEFSLTGPSLPMTIQPGTPVSFTLAFRPQTSGAASASVSFTTGGSSTPVTEALTGTGAATALPHSVELAWAASSSKVAGYNVYRGTATGGPYEKVNSSVDLNVTYTDSSVEAGQTYFYTTTAISSGGTESSYSNEVKAVIPTP